MMSGATGVLTSALRSMRVSARSVCGMVVVGGLGERELVFGGEELGRKAVVVRPWCGEVVVVLNCMANVTVTLLLMYCRPVTAEQAIPETYATTSPKYFLV